jgi:hypothetical protein
MSPTLRALAVTGAAAAVAAAGVAAAVPATAATTTPTVSGLSPASGPPGETLDIFGSGFTGATGVTVGSSLPVRPTPVGTAGAELSITVPTTATTGHVVVTTPSGSSPATSGPTFTVQRASGATATVSRATTTYPQHVTVHGTLTAAGAGVKGARADLQRRFAGSMHWADVAGTGTLTTDRSGRVAWRVRPANDQDYRVVFGATSGTTGATTAARPVGVRPLVRLSLPSALPAPQRTPVSGRVSPHLNGRLTVQRKLGSGRWATVGHARPAKGRFTTTLVTTSTGKYRFRVLRAADRRHLTASTGTLVTTAVHRTLSEGSTGADVTTLQRRLRALHYDGGPVNGSYGTDTVHAVTAFEKVQGMTRDGVASAAVWSKLAHPRKPKLRHPMPGTAVEIDLKRQVLLIAKKGKVWRILDTSSAGGYLYTDSEGQTERAVTPTGHFSIRYKQEGLVHSKLGTLFRPSYFNDSGYAIHGEGNGTAGGEVPPYPNSHGCVRITDNAVNRYYSLLAVGTSVWIYR